MDFVSELHELWLMLSFIRGKEVYMYKLKVCTYLFRHVAFLNDWPTSEHANPSSMYNVQYL